MKRASRCVALIVLAAGCGGGGAANVSAPTTPTFTSLGLSATTATIAVGGTYQLQVVPKDQFGATLPSSPTPSFVSSDRAVATVDAAGLVTGAASGTATITVSATIDGVTHSATCQVTISSVGNAVSTAGFVFTPPTITIAVGDSVTWQFVEAPHNVTFSGLAPAAGDVPDQQPGAQVSRVFAAPGTYDYECTIHSGMQGSVVVQSGQAPVYTSLGLAPETPAIAVGGTVQLVATPLDQNGSAMAGLPAPTFSTTSTAVSLSPTGLVTGLAAGTATVTASLTAAGATHSATSTVTVTAPQPGSVTVTTPNRTFSPPSVTIAPGGQVTWQFSGSTHNVTFSGPAPAGGNIPDVQPGNAVSRTFSTAGTYDYECTRHNGMTGTIVVQGGGGGGGVFTSLSVTPATPSFSVGSSVQLTATPLDQNGNPMTGLPAATFSSGGPAVATVTTSGLVTGVAPGGATVTATLTASGVTRTGTATVTVTQGPGGSVTVGTAGNVFTPDDVDLVPGGTVTWLFEGATHNVTFDDEAPAGGNIPDTAPGGSVARTFTVAGTYDYRCTIHDKMEGRIRVR